MSAKVEITPSKTIKETVAQNMNINRYVNGIDPVYNINLTYGENEFLATDDGVKTRLLSSGMNSKSITLPPEKVLEFFNKAVMYDGKNTTLGELLATLMDEVIAEDLKNPSPSNIGPIVPPVIQI